MKRSRGESCYHCEGRLKLHSRKAESGVGCFLIAMGLLFAPVLIGVPLMVVGAVVADKKTYWRECSRCGQRLTGRGSFTPKPDPFYPIAAAVLGLIVVAICLGICFALGAL